MAGHAKFSPSSLHRRLACIGSMAMEEGYPDSASEYAQEGTAAHFLAATCLTSEKNAVDYIGETIYLLPRGEDFVLQPGDEVEAQFEVTEEMAGYVQTYVDNIRQYALDSDLYVEMSLPIGHITTEDEAYGTGDAIIFSAGSDEIQVHDLKYGFRRVSAEANPQLMCYALGALKLFEGFSEFKRARLVIHQPRVCDEPDEWVVEIDELLKFAEEVTSKAKAAFYYVKTGDDPSGVLTPSAPGDDDYCRYCKALAKCPARIAMVEAEVGKTLDEMQGDVPPIDDSVLTKAMLAIPYIEAWCTAVRAEVERKLLAGEQVDQYKLVEGRRGGRAWGSPEEVEARMKAMRIKADDMYDKKLISPASAEKKVKSGAIKAKQWAELQTMVTQADGKPSVAHISDKRPALEVKPVLDGFEEIEEGSEFI